MELRTLWLGLALSVAAFAVKAGLGWAHLWSVTAPARRPRASLAVAGSYAALFALAALLVAKVNLLAHYDLLAPLWREGVTLHWATALVMLLWGLALMRRPADARCGPSRGWLALVVPCPVCLSVLLMSASALALYFPESARAALAALFGAFVVVAAASGAVSLRFGGGGGSAARLGLVMIAVASYFMLSAMISPRFPDLARVYRLASGARSGGGGVPLGPRLACLGAIALLAGAGFLAARLGRGARR
jgi:predicted transporter